MARAHLARASYLIITEIRPAGLPYAKPPKGYWVNKDERTHLFALKGEVNIDNV